MICSGALRAPKIMRRSQTAATISSREYSSASTQTHRRSGPDDAGDRDVAREISRSDINVDCFARGRSASSRHHRRRSNVCYPTQVERRENLSRRLAGKIRLLHRLHGKRSLGLARVVVRRAKAYCLELDTGSVKIQGWRLQRICGRPGERPTHDRLPSFPAGAARDSRRFDHDQIASARGCARKSE